MTRAHFFTLSAFAACLSLYGCTDDNTQTDVPTKQEYDDVAKSFGSVVAADGNGGEVSSLHDASDLAVGVMPFGFSLDAQGEINGNRLGLEYSYALTCRDATGTEQDVCDETTDSADVSVSWSGDLSIPPTFMSQVSRSGQWSLTGITEDSATLEGDSSFDLDVSFMNDSTSRAYHLSYSGQYDGILIERGPFRVVGGTVTYAIDAERHEAYGDAGTVDKTFRIDAVLTFHADGSATLVLDGTYTYDLDVSSGEVTFRAEG